MNWTEVLQDKSLQDLPYKIETNQFGQIVMSPASNMHSVLQTEIAILIASQKLGGRAIVECSIETGEGVKVPDVVWASAEFLAQYGREISYPASPELCVEVVSPSNSPEEIRQKIALYFQHGAQEVWTCDLTGAVSSFSPDGEQKQSILFPQFPVRIVI